jgi:hypothetical protein
MSKDNIQPQDIDTTKHFWDAFGRLEKEISANFIVRFCQERNEGWAPFTYAEIETFYNKYGFKDFDFNGLVGGPLIYRNDKYHFMPAFSRICYKASPKKE